MHFFQAGVVDHLKEKKIKISHVAHKKYGVTMTLDYGTPFMKSSVSKSFEMTLKFMFQSHLLKELNKMGISGGLISMVALLFSL